MKDFFLAFSLLIIFACASLIVAPSAEPVGPEAFMPKENDKPSIDETKYGRLIPLTGFSYCPQLDGSLFDGDTLLDSQRVLAILQTLEGSNMPRKFKSMISRTKQFLKKLWNLLTRFRWEVGNSVPASPPYIALKELAEFYPAIVDEVARALDYFHISKHIVDTFDVNHPGGPRNVLNPVERSSSRRFSCYLAASDWVNIALTK